MLNFKGGLKLEQHKYTKDSEAKRLPSPASVKIFSYGDDICVKIDDCVRIGDKLTAREKAHSSVSGVVKDISQGYVTIENDNKNEISPEHNPFNIRLSEASFEEIIEFARRKGIYFGDDFLAHKLEGNKGRARILIVSCSNTAPFICSTHRVLCEKKKEIIFGAKIIMKALDISKAAVAINKSSKKEIAEFESMLSSAPNFEVVTHTDKYPAHDSSVLMSAFLKKYISAKDIGRNNIMCITADEAVAVFEAFRSGMPMVEKLITVDGDAVSSPMNLYVPIGTSVREVLEHCGADFKLCHNIAGGNPLCSHPLSLEDYVDKNTDAIIALSKRYDRKAGNECIACGKCHMVCPVGLYPDRLLSISKFENKCLACGCCSYICPARLDFSSIYTNNTEVNDNE